LGLTGFSRLRSNSFGGPSRIVFIFHHFPEESDETQSRLTAEKNK
jgi:hypothetical protein